MAKCRGRGAHGRVCSGRPRWHGWGPGSQTRPPRSWAVSALRRVVPNFRLRAAAWHGRAAPSRHALPTRTPNPASRPGPPPRPVSPFLLIELALAITPTATSPSDRRMIASHSQTVPTQLPRFPSHTLCEAKIRNLSEPRCRLLGVIEVS